jgi:hypothetical protein
VARPPTPWILWWATIVHLVLGTLLILHPEVASVSVLIGLHIFLEAGMSPQFLGAITLFAGLCSVCILLTEHQRTLTQIVIGIMPQYMLVFVSFMADAHIVVSGEFMGRPVPFPTAMAGLWPIMCAALMHTFAIIERYMPWIRR